MRFTIRDLLWLMVVVGMSLGWIMDHRNTSTLRGEVASVRWQLKALAELAKEHGFHVTAADGEVSLGGPDKR